MHKFRVIRLVGVAAWCYPGWNEWQIRYLSKHRLTCSRKWLRSAPEARFRKKQPMAPASANACGRRSNEYLMTFVCVAVECVCLQQHSTLKNVREKSVKLSRVQSKFAKLLQTYESWMNDCTRKFPFTDDFVQTALGAHSLNETQSHCFETALITQGAFVDEDFSGESFDLMHFPFRHHLDPRGGDIAFYIHACTLRLSIVFPADRKYFF